MLARRDAAVNALRNLIGSVDTSYGPNDWPRGLEAFRRLNEQLDEAGQSDLRSLFSEADITHIFDELVDLASSSDSDSLRAVGSIATGTLGRIERLIAFARSPANIVSPESPPLASYLSALRLFADAFDGSLVYIARPPILSYGLYGAAGLDAISRRMLELIQHRNALAEQVDCIMECSCDVEDIRVQLQADKLLFDVDRAIDYYALSDQANGGGLLRSIAYGALSAKVSALGVPVLGQQLVNTLNAITATLRWPAPLPGNLQQRTILANLLQQEICLQQQAEPRWEQLVISLSPRCALAAMNSDVHPDETVIGHLLGSTHDEIVNHTGIAFAGCATVQVGIPPHFETSLDMILHDFDPNGFDRP
jgi:hypothetical protein